MTEEELRAALQEARDRADRLDFLLGAADLDIKGWFDRAEQHVKRAVAAEAALREARERMYEVAAHIESLLGHAVGERGEMVLYAADINALGARARQLRAASRPVPVVPCATCGCIEDGAVVHTLDATGTWYCLRCAQKGGGPMRLYAHPFIPAAPPAQEEAQG